MVACGMIVALMASLGSKFNASATLFTMDFYREWFPNASGRTEVFVGRWRPPRLFSRHLLGAGDQEPASNLYVYLQTCRDTSRRPSPCCSDGRLLETRHGPRRLLVLLLRGGRRLRTPGCGHLYAELMIPSVPMRKRSLPRSDHPGSIQGDHRTHPAKIRTDL